MQRTDWELEKTLMLGKIEGKRRRGQQRMRWLDGITNSMNTNPLASSGKYWRTGKAGVLQSMGSQSRTRLKDWTTQSPLMSSCGLLLSTWQGRCYSSFLEMRCRLGEAKLWPEVAVLMTELETDCLTRMPVTLGPAVPAACRTSWNREFSGASPGQLGVSGLSRWWLISMENPKRFPAAVLVRMAGPLHGRGLNENTKPENWKLCKHWERWQVYWLVESRHSLNLFMLQLNSSLIGCQMQASDSEEVKGFCSTFPRG